MVAHALLLSAVVIWGWTFVATKVLVAELTPVEVLALRLALGLPFLGLVLLAKRVRLRFDREDALPLLLGGGILAAHFLIQIKGLETTTASNTGWIISASPLALAFLSRVILGERIGGRAVAGIAVATTGILLLVSRGRLTDLGWMHSVGDWLILVSAHTWALYTVATRDLSRRRNALAVTFAILAIAAVAAGAAFATSGDLMSIRALSFQGWMAALYLAIPGLALGQWFWQEGVARLGAAQAGLYLYLEPVATLTLAVPFLGEPLGPFILLGGGLILGGVWMGQSGRRS